MKKMLLKGVRIADLTRVWSGPLATRILGDLGAEVIKVEDLRSRGLYWQTGAEEQDSTGLGLFPEGKPGEQPWNRSGTFNDYNRNKYGVTLDLNTEPGKELFKRLVAVSDVVIENYTPRVMKNFGLEYPALREVNPSLIMISLPAFGRSGPYRDYLGWGPEIEAVAGITTLMGYSKDEPCRMGYAYTDPATSLHSVGAILLALLHRRLTGEGQYIELAQSEMATSLIGHQIVGFSLTGREPQPQGNRHPYAAPHGPYRCKGDNQWIAITVTSDEEWKALCSVMGNPSWTRQDLFSDQLSRWKNQSELVGLIEQWTSQHDHYSIMQMLQKAGVAAAAVLDNKEVLSDPHLKERGFFWDVAHPQAGTFPYPGPPMRFSKTAPTLRKPAPCLGEHNQEILVGLLGLPQEELAQLEEQGVIGTKPPSLE